MFVLGDRFRRDAARLEPLDDAPRLAALGHRAVGQRGHAGVGAGLRDLQHGDAVFDGIEVDGDPAIIYSLL